MREIVKDHEIQECEDGIGKVAWLTEPYMLHPEDYDRAHNLSFDAIFSPHRLLTETYANCYYSPIGGTFIDPNDWYAYHKNKKIAMFISDKDGMPGHKLRHRVFDKLDCGFVEYYGKYANNFIYKKLHGLFDAGYAIIVESQVSSGYFTEKILDCFLTGTIPIYHGDPDINYVFHGSGIIEWDTIDNLKAIIGYIDKLYWKTRTEKMESIGKNFELAKNFIDTELNFKRAYEGVFE